MATLHDGRRSPTAAGRAIKPPPLGLPSISRSTGATRHVAAVVLSQNARLGRVQVQLCADVVVAVFGVVPEERHDVFHAKLADCLAFDGGGGELTLLLLQGENALFYRVFDGKFVDDDVNCLVQAVDAIDGLLFDELEEKEG